jgi:hypothetical protein
LSQWRAYSGGENGYAIGFSGPGVFIGAGLSHNYLAAVNYDRALHDEIAATVADQTVSFFTEGLRARGNVDREQWHREFATVWGEACAWIAPVIKDPAFKSEEEWRLVRPLNAADVASMKYRQRRSMMTRHLPITLALPGSARPLPIVEIMVGPSRHKESSRASVGDLLQAHGYPHEDNRVTISHIPFQST